MLLVLLLRMTSEPAYYDDLKCFSRPQCNYRSLKQNTFGLLNMSLKQPDFFSNVNLCYWAKTTAKTSVSFFLFFCFLTQFVGFYCVQVVKDHN